MSCLVAMIQVDDCQLWEHHWGQTYTFDKMWIIDRRLLTLEKYDLNILRKTIKSTSVPEPFRMRFEIRGPVALILDY